MRVWHRSQGSWREEDDASPRSLPLQKQGAAAEKSEFMSGCFCVTTEEKKAALESGLLELEETTFHKRFERDQSKVASGPCFPLPAECNWSSLHGEGTMTCGDHDTCLSCT